MITWLKAALRGTRRETHDEKARRIRALVSDVVPAYGQIMDASPLVVFPASKLPLPKDEMKIALQLAWDMTSDERVREHVTVADLHLAHFRDDINSPIDPTLTKNLTPEQVVRVLNPYVELTRKIDVEIDELRKEFEEFRRLSMTLR